VPVLPEPGQLPAVAADGGEELHYDGAGKVDDLFPEVPVRDGLGPVREGAFDGKRRLALAAQGPLSPPPLRYPVLPAAVRAVDNEAWFHISIWALSGQCQSGCTLPLKQHEGCLLTLSRRINLL